MTSRPYGRTLAALLLATLPLVAGAGTGAGAATAAGPSFTPEERAAAIARPAVVYLEIEWEGWVRDKRDGLLWDSESVYFVSRCSGFVVSQDGYIVTAGHCVDPGPEGAAPAFYQTIADRFLAAGIITEGEYGEALAAISENSEIEGATGGDPAIRNVYVQRGVATSGLTSGQAFPARVVDFSPLSDGDVALLKVDEEDLPAVAVAPGSGLPVGTSVLAIGYPGSADEISDATLEPSNKDGKISNLRTEDGVPFYESSAAMTSGMSGGPVVDLEGRVIGLVSHGPARESQAFNFVAASSLIGEMLARNGITSQLSDLDQQYRTGLEHYFAGRYTRAIASFDGVLALLPSHQQAQEYRQQAVERREVEGDADAVNWAAVGGLAGGALCLLASGTGVAVLLVVRSRRRRRQAAAGGWPPADPAVTAPLSPTVPPAPLSPTVPPAPLSPTVSPTTAYPPGPYPPQPASPAGPYPPQPAAVPADQPEAWPAAVRATASVPAPNAGGPAATATTAAAAAPAGRFCSGCGTQAAPGGRFCTACGTPLG